MKKRHIMTILALSVMLLGTQVQNTYGTDEIVADQGVAATAMDLSDGTEAAFDQTPVEETPYEEWVPDEEIVEEPVEEEPSEEIGEEPSEEVGEEPSEDVKDSEESDSEKTDSKEPSEDVKDEADSSEKKDDADSAEKEDSKKEDSKKEDPKKEDSKKEDSKDQSDKVKEETSENNKNDDQKTEASDKVTSDKQKTESKPVSDPENDKMNEKVREIIDGSYKPSEDFVSWCDKVKYSVDTPIEGLPPFINQEMVVGALKSQDEHGIPASVTIAQIVAESGFGSYGEGGEKGLGLSYLAYGYNNLFGVKGTGTAGSVQLKTGEQDKAGNKYTITAGFRVYYTYTEAIEDRAEILTKYYDDLTEGVQDANTYAMKIAGRWATGITYGKALIEIMERYDLYRLDKMTLQEYSDLVGSFINPCPGSTLTDGFGYRDVPIAGATAYHKGIDLGTGAYNLPTYAVKEGTVTFAAYDSGAGNLIIIDHGNGLVTKYMHHKQIYVKVGDKVVQGQQIGLSGTTGVSTGNHLHFQVEENGIAVNPASYFKEKK